MDDHIDTTEAVLGELGLSKVPTLLVLNKCDRLPAGEAERKAAARGAVAVAAIDRGSFGALLSQLEAMLFHGAPAPAASGEGDVRAHRDGPRRGRGASEDPGGNAVVPLLAARGGAGEARGPDALPFFDDAAFDALLEGQLPGRAAPRRPARVRP
jgi:GTP-binding protein HflX